MGGFENSAECCFKVRDDTRQASSNDAHAVIDSVNRRSHTVQLRKVAGATPWQAAG